MFPYIFAEQKRIKNLIKRNWYTCASKQILDRYTMQRYIGKFMSFSSLSSRQKRTRVGRIVVMEFLPKRLKHFLRSSQAINEIKTTTLRTYVSQKKKEKDLEVCYIKNRNIKRSVYCQYG